jgi:hypothetical protein
MLLLLLLLLFLEPVSRRIIRYRENLDVVLRRVEISCVNGFEKLIQLEHFSPPQPSLLGPA